MLLNRAEVCDPLNIPSMKSLNTAGLLQPMYFLEQNGIQTLNSPELCKILFAGRATLSRIFKRKPRNVPKGIVSSPNSWWTGQENMCLNCSSEDSSERQQ